MAEPIVFDQDVANTVASLLNSYAAYGATDTLSDFLDYIEQHVDSDSLPDVVNAAREYWNVYTGKETYYG